MKKWFLVCIPNGRLQSEGSSLKTLDGKIKSHGVQRQTSESAIEHHPCLFALFKMKLAISEKERLFSGRISNSTGLPSGEALRHLIQRPRFKVLLKELNFPIEFEKSHQCANSNYLEIKHRLFPNKQKYICHL